jgi:hypothetical protein
MLDIILAAIVVALVKLTFVYIGGFIRWVVFRKKSLKEYVKDDWEGNLAAFLLTVALVAVVVILFTV